MRHVAPQLRQAVCGWHGPHSGGAPWAVRVEAVRRLLTERPNLQVQRVALQCGFFDDERMRRAFLRGVGVPPTEYRARFAATS